jgi:hypothetical protein
VALKEENEQVSIKVELVSADKAGEILERALKIRNPQLWQTRRENAAKQKAKARRQGKPLPPVSRWAPYKLNIGNGRRVERNPMEKLGLSNLNRPISLARTDLYAEEIEAGRWYFTPDRSSSPTRATSSTDSTGSGPPPRSTGHRQKRSPVPRRLARRQEDRAPDGRSKAERG